MQPVKKSFEKEGRAEFLEPQRSSKDVYKRQLYDEKGIRETARRVQAAFSWNAGFREHFAVKANPNPYILSILKSEGCGVDCASITELMLAKAVGFEGDDIMFSSNMTPAEDYIYARKLGAIINLDDITHIE